MFRATYLPFSSCRVLAKISNLKFPEKFCKTFGSPADFFWYVRVISLLHLHALPQLDHKGGLFLLEDGLTCYLKMGHT